MSDEAFDEWWETLPEVIPIHTTSVARQAWNAAIAWHKARDLAAVEKNITRGCHCIACDEIRDIKRLRTARIDSAVPLDATHQCGKGCPG